MWEGLGFFAYALFFYALGRLHREDRVDPRMKWFFLALAPFIWGAAFTLAPILFTTLKLGLRDTFIIYSPTNMSIKITSKFNSGISGRPDIVYIPLGEWIHLILLGIATLSPWAFYTLGREGFGVSISGAEVDYWWLTFKYWVYKLAALKVPEPDEKAYMWYTKYRFLESRVKLLEMKVRELEAREPSFYLQNLQISRLKPWEGIEVEEG